MGGYRFGEADNAWQVPAVRAMAAGEFAADYIYSQPLSLSLFFPLVAALSRLFDLSALYFAGYAAASVASAALIYRFAFKTLGSASAAILAVVLLLTKKDIIAGATTWDPLFLPRTAAMPFMILSWLMLIEKKFIGAGLMVGLASALHPLTGVYSGVISVIYLVMTQPGWWRDVVLFSLAALPFAAIVVLTESGPGPALVGADPAWYRAMLVRNIHHLVSDRFLVMAGLLLYGLWVSVRLRDLGRTQGLLQAAIVGSAVAFMYAGGALVVGGLLELENPALAALYPPALTVLQPLRISGLLGILLLVATAGILAEAFNSTRLGAILAAATVMALFHGQWVAGGMLAAAAMISRQAGVWRGVAGGLIALAAAGTAALGDLSLLLLLAAAALLAAALWHLAPLIGAKGASGALAAVVILAGVVPASWAPWLADSLFGVEPEAAARYETAVKIDITGEAAFEEAARWAAAHAAADDVIIIPPWWEGFRIASGRPVYGTWKDGTLVFFRHDLAGAWLGRMALLAAPLAPAGGSRYPDWGVDTYRALRAADFMDAARRFPARYAVSERGSVENLHEVYRGDYVYIYDLSQGGVGL